MKNQFSKFMAMSVLLTGFVFTACDPTEDPIVDPDVTTELKGNITGAVTLGAETTLAGTVIVEDGGVLTIPAGAVIKAQRGFENYILVAKGGKIIAEGTAAAPITFKGDSDSATAGYWGGLILNGKAPIAGAAEGAEGSTEVNNEIKYGGTEVADNSGVLKYVQIFHSGAKSSANVEHNGLTLNGVGNGTTIENLYIVSSTDDGVEFFGGSVNVTNLLVVNSDDDMFDFTQGYTGTLKNAYGVWTSDFASAEEDPRGIEADGNLDGKTPGDVNQSNFKVENVTIYNNSADIKMHDVIKVRRGATATITNALVKGSSAMVGDLIDTEDKKGAATATTKISLTNALDYSFTGTAVNGAVGEIVEGNTGADFAQFAWTGYELGSSTVAPNAVSVLNGNITGNVSTTKEVSLEGTVIVEDGAVLTIPAGAVIKAKAGFENYILVAKGGKIYANGTATAPIVFKGDSDSATAGYWGGLILNGKAPIAGAAEGAEGSTEVNNEIKYGGTEVADNSGVLKYVQIFHSGAKSSANVEHNGLTLNGVGNGTTIENLYIVSSTDDGVEFFGGSVNVTNLLVVNSDDDMFDFTQGYTGTLKNAYGVWTSDFASAEEDPRGIEADGNLDGKTPGDVNQSNFKVQDVTFDNNSADIKMHDVIKVRRGATATITNALVKGSSAMVGDLIDTKDGKGAATAATTISLTNTLANPFTGTAINGEVGEIVSGNTGADTAAFGWTGYKF